VSTCDSCVLKIDPFNGTRTGLSPKIRGQIYLGSEAFIEKHSIGYGTELAEVPRLQRQALRPGLEQILGKKSQRSIERTYREHGYRLKEIAQYLGVHYSTVSHRLKESEASS
jgi:putative transposase